MYRILTIDPSVQAMGYAVFEVFPVHLGDAPPHTTAHLKDSGCYTYPKHKNEEYCWLEAMDAMVEAVVHEVHRWAPANVFIEQPDYLKPEAVKTVPKLIACAYSIRQALLGPQKGFDLGGALVQRVQMVAVNEWKGNTPKTVTQDRVAKHWGWDGTDHNEADAVGVGDYVLRKLKGVRPICT